MQGLLVRAAAAFTVGSIAFGAGAAAGQPASGGAASAERALLDRYCVTCHNERLRVADLTLDTADVADVGAHPEIWEKVVRRLRAGAMPPAPRPRPDAAAYEGFTAWPRDRARRGGGAESRSRAHRHLPSAQSQRVSQRHPGSPGPRGRRRGAAAGRRRQLRVRQHRGGARHLADAAGTLSVGREEDQPAGHRATGPVGDGRDVPPRHRPDPGRPGRRVAVRHPRRDEFRLHVSGRCGGTASESSSPAMPAVP